MTIQDRSVTTTDTSSTSLTYSHTVNGSSNLVLYVYIDCYSGGGTTDPTGITYNSVALTKLTSYATSLDSRPSLWRLINPATGANNVVVSFGSTHDITAISISYSGVNQTTPEDTAVANNTDSETPSHDITSEPGDLVISCCGGWNPRFSGYNATGALTRQAYNDNGTGVNSAAIGDASGSSPTVTVGWEMGGSIERHGQISANLNAAGAAATKGPPIPLRRYRKYRRSF